jgi:hypothetical protein
MVMVDRNLESQLRVMLDKQEIHDALMRYCRGVDRCDADLIRSAFHSDAIDDHGTHRGPASEFVDLIVDGVQKVASMSMHFIGNVLIEVEDDLAYSEAYFVSYLTQTRDGTEYTRSRGGRYVDRFERRNGEWKIALRVVVDDWSRLDPVVERGDVSERQGQRSHSDAVWAIRGGTFDDVPA